MSQNSSSAAFNFLEQQTRLHGDVLPWKVLSEGFQLEGRRVPLVSQQGIFKPAVLAEIPLSIRTTPPKEGQPAPYPDELGDDNLIRYCYRGTDGAHPENAGLRKAMMQRVPVIYLYGIVPGEYLAAWPAYIVADDAGPKQPAFSVAVDDREFVGAVGGAGDEALADYEGNARRHYVTHVTQQRLHQGSFRRRVLRAYKERCTICSLGHEPLLDAAHILDDKHPLGEPTVNNGLALCKIHHAAYDANILGIRPDRTIHIRADILEEKDGPMLKHGLQGIHDQRLVVPRSAELRPKEEFLEERYEAFLRY